MRFKSGRCLVLAVLLVASAQMLHAGQIYGTIVVGGQGLKEAKIEIQCGQDAPVAGATAADGAYRINVPQQGQCTLALPAYEGRPAASIFSSPNPTAYNFELTKLADGKYELKRR